jgi:hypothetical protein
MSELLRGMDEGDAYLPRVHLFVAYTKILHSMSAHEIGWVDGLGVDRGTSGPQTARARKLSVEYLMGGGAAAGRNEA